MSDTNHMSADDEPRGDIDQVVDEAEARAVDETSRDNIPEAPSEATVLPESTAHLEAAPVRRPRALASGAWVTSRNTTTTIGGVRGSGARQPSSAVFWSWAPASSGPGSVA